MAIIILIIGGLLLTVGDIFMKEWLIKNSNTFFIIGLIIYFISMVLLALSYKFENIAIASTIIEIINTISVILIFTIFFKENLSITQIAGLVLGVISIILLKIE